MTNNGSTTTITDYAAGFVYTGNELQFAGIEEGRMLYNDQSGEFDREEMNRLPFSHTDWKY